MPPEHIDPVLDDLWGDPAEAATLRRLRALMAGGALPRRPYQAPVSFRIMPRLLARLRRAAEAALAAAATSLCAITDNPVFLPPDSDHPRGRVLSTGGFHNAMAAPAMDELAAAYADLATLAERHSAKLLTGAVSRLPDQLLVEGDEQNFLGCLPMAGVGLAEAARHAAQRTFLPASESGGFAQNDVATPNFLAWEHQEEAGRCLDGALASLSLVIERAFEITKRPAPEGLRPLLHEIREAGQPQSGPAGLARASERLVARYRARVYAPTTPE
jgi:histidine ammonia-lyase